MAAQHIGIAGAGLLGRLLAWRLSVDGHAVTVFDPASGPLDRGQAAGWTAAGMLSAWAELESADADVARLGLRSLVLWADTVSRLPMPVHFQRDGSLLLAHRSDLGTAQRLVGVLQGKMPIGHAPRALTAMQLRDLEPAVHGPTHAWMLDGEGQIHSVQAMLALADAATRSGARWRWGTTIDELAPGRIGGERFYAVFDVRGVGARPDLPVRGVRGEILWLHARGLTLQRPLRLLHPRSRVYLVPRPDDIVVVGASEIESEDRSPIPAQDTTTVAAAAHALSCQRCERHPGRGAPHLRAGLPQPARSEHGSGTCLAGHPRLSYPGPGRPGAAVRPVWARAAAVPFLQEPALPAMSERRAGRLTPGSARRVAAGAVLSSCLHAAACPERPGAIPCPLGLPHVDAVRRGHPHRVCRQPPLAGRHAGLHPRAAHLDAGPAPAHPCARADGLRRAGRSRPPVCAQAQSDVPVPRAVRQKARPAGEQQRIEELASQNLRSLACRYRSSSRTVRE